MINELSKNQNVNGSFKDSVFFTSLIASCLDDKASKDRALKWILSQKNEDFVFDSELGINFYALIAILKCEPGVIDGSALAKILKTLILSETEEGGPYVNKDLGRNAVIAYFLSLQDVDLPNIENLISEHINQKNFESELFKNKYFVIYLISKFLKNEKEKQLLINYLIGEKYEQNDFNHTLILNSLLDLGYDKESLKEEIGLLKNQTSDAEYPFYMSTNNEIVNAPSFLNIAFYLELLGKINKEGQDSEENTFSQKEESVIKQILELAKQRFSDLPLEMQEIALDKIKRTIKGNKDKQMSLMPYYTKEALGRKGKQIEDKTIIEMGLANIFFWTAFIIYDDFWDEDESASPQILPTANLYARHYVNYFSFLFREMDFNAFFHKLMDNLDAANTWETMYCRAKINGSKFIIPEALPEYGDYELKFYPSSGHILSSVALFYSLGYDENSKEVKNLIAYFKNYLIAMQINDDVHDFEEDLNRGHLSTAIVLLLQDFKEEYPDATEIDLIDDLKRLQHIFWFKTVAKACSKAIYHTQKSREALHNIGIIEDFAPLEHYINITENAAKKALEEQKKSLDFLETFK